MTVVKARRDRRRYAWAFNRSAAPYGHFEILDTGTRDDPLCDVIATTPNAELREFIIARMEAEEYQPARWVTR